MQDAWMIIFEDKSVPPEFYSGEGAEEAAHRRFRDCLINWNCHLFRKISDVADPFNGERFHAKALLSDVERNSGAFDHFMDIDRRVLATALRLAISSTPK